MHIYSCPYCLPDKRARLTEQNSKVTTYCSCPFTENFWGDPVRECKTKKVDCKNDKKIMRCIKCQNEFVITPDFLKERKRKIKDG